MQARSIAADRRANAAQICVRTCLNNGKWLDTPRRRAARRARHVRTAVVSGCSRPQQLHTNGLYSIPSASMADKCREYALRLRTRMLSVQSAPACADSTAAMPTSKAEACPGDTAEVKTSAGRKPGAVSSSPSTYLSAVASARRVKSSKQSRTSLWPRVLSPGAQHVVCTAAESK